MLIYFSFHGATKVFFNVQRSETIASSLEMALLMNVPEAEAEEKVMHLVGAINSRHLN